MRTQVLEVLIMSLFEQMGGTYRNENGYLIPNFQVPAGKEGVVGIYGQRHLNYLREHCRVRYINLLTSGKLNAYLVEIDEYIRERLMVLIEQMKQAQGITEWLKAENGLEWVQRMNNIRECAMEIVNEEVVYR